MTSRSIPVLLIHGFTTSKLSNLPLHNTLRKNGFHTYNVDIPGLNTQDMHKSAMLVQSRVNEIKEKHVCEKIQLVGISMGGLIGLHYLTQLQGHENIISFVTLGTPFKGVTAANALKDLAPGRTMAIKQMGSRSPFIKALKERDFGEVSVTSIGAVGDTLVPEPLFHLEGANNLLSEHAMWPTGHYDLVLRKNNHRLLIKELDKFNPAV